MGRVVKIGIYKITNIINNKIYIGSSISLNRRKYCHFYHLNNNKHHSKYLQNAWNKYGKENFIFEIIKECTKEELILTEQYYIDLYKPVYNMNKIAGGHDRPKHPIEVIEKIRKANLGRIVSEEVRRKISNTLKGRKREPHTEEYKRKLSIAKKGKCTISREQILSNVYRSSLITRKKISQIDDFNNVIKTYVSITEAARDLNISHKRISACITGVRKHYKGMKFKYEE